MSNSPRIDRVDKNYLINGNFDFWQRGTSFTATGFGADRWHLTATSTPTFLRANSTIPTGSSFYATLRTTANTQSWSIRQPIESIRVREVAGKTVTFSILLRRNAAYDQSVILNIQTNTVADTSTGGTWSTLATVTVPNASISTSGWTQFSVTASIPGNVQGLGVQVSQGAVTTGNPAEVYIAQAQLSIGDVAPEFTMSGRSYTEEMLMCQRFYQRWDWDGTGNNRAICIAGAITATRALGTLPLRVDMRTAPSLIVSAQTDFGLNIATETVTTAISFRTVTVSTVEIDLTVASGLTVGSAYRLSFRNTVGAKFLSFDAEL